MARRLRIHATCRPTVRFQKHVQKAPAKRETCEQIRPHVSKRRRTVLWDAQSSPNPIQVIDIDGCDSDMRYMNKLESGVDAGHIQQVAGDQKVIAGSSLSSVAPDRKPSTLDDLESRRLSLESSKSVSELDRGNQAFSAESISSGSSELDDIQSAIRYSRHIRSGNNTGHTRVRFSVPTSVSSPALRMLRQAFKDGLAERIYTDPELEHYELSQKPALLQDYGIDPLWFVGQTPAQVKAGPLASEAGFKKANKSLRAATLRKNKRGLRSNKQQTNNDRKLEEGLRRQEKRLPMSDDC